jgi:hypothetical protein
MASRSRAGLSIAVILLLAACTSGGSTEPPVATPSAEASTAASTSTAPSLAPSSNPGGSPDVTQTDTDWGRIWDGLPSGFPTYPGATPDDAASGGPASAVLVVEGLDAQGVATFLQTLLVKAGFTTEGLTGPLEDGSYVLDMTGPPVGCVLQVATKPTGGLTTVTILYGAACPFT